MHLKMPRRPGVTYSREETIAAVTDYYKFLTTLYLKDSQVHYPPAGGWPSIVNASKSIEPDALAALGKTDEVLTLLAHLPYIRRPHGWWESAEVAPGCYFADWQASIAHLTSGHAWEDAASSLRLVTEGVDLYKVAPPHVVGLTEGDRENPIIVLDTKFGIIHWEDYTCPWSIQHDSVLYDPYDYEDEDDEYDEEDDDEDEDGEDEDGEDEDGEDEDGEDEDGEDEDGEDEDGEDEDGEDEDGEDKDGGEGEGGEDVNCDEDKDKDHDNHADHDDNDKRDAAVRQQELEWRRYAPAWTIAAFFEVLKDQLKKLQWIPTGHYRVMSVPEDYSRDMELHGMVTELREIYHQHGWPDLARYRKSECMEAVNKLMKERYPSQVEP